MQQAYAGEHVTFRVNLDTSAADPDYDLSTATLVAFAALHGSDEYIATFDVDVDDTEAGIADIDADLADIGEGVYRLWVEDSAAPLMLAVDDLVVTLRPSASGDAPKASVADVPYSIYYAIGAATIPEGEWRRWRNEAKRVVRDVTRGRDLDSADYADDVYAIQDAICRAADKLYEAEHAVSSEKLGSYSYTKANTPSEDDAARVARAALVGTGLAYSGLDAGVYPGPRYQWTDKDPCNC